MSKIPKKTKYELKIGKSNSGLGLFATEEIPKAEFVIEYFGEYLSEEQTNEKCGKYLFKVDKKTTIDGSARSNIARYVNHSCKPNCEAILEGKRIFIYSKRKIKAGEEITYHYGKEYYEDVIKPMGCKCGNH